VAAHSRRSDTLDGFDNGINWMITSLFQGTITIGFDLIEMFFQAYGEYVSKQPPQSEWIVYIGLLPVSITCLSARTQKGRFRS